MGLIGNPTQSPEDSSTSDSDRMPGSEVCVADTSYILITTNNWREGELKSEINGCIS